jgi:hydrogenase maturation protein HypF
MPAFPMSGPHQQILLSFRGRVQGVGFRPAAYRLATGLGLRGWVANGPDGARILLSGPADAVAAFRARLPEALPPAAAIESAEARPATADELRSLPPAFAIRPSGGDGPRTAGILPDLATCPQCLAEILDPAARRFRYPFTNCTHCGPRYSIIAALPYDRPNTVMRDFPLCPDCRAEYENPADRRFHAQPVACPVCGPHLRWLDAAGRPAPAVATDDDALRAAADLLRAGGILALKGIGGFHLLVDARAPDAVARLRRRKARPAKPFAVMFPCLDALARDCLLPPGAREVLVSPAAPILLLPRHPASTLPYVLAPGLATLGVFLPYSPLHHLLLRDLAFPVVATSGNRSEEPICISTAEAVDRLSGIADAFLTHNRRILRPMDDSVAMLHRGRPVALRRARGLAPYAFPLPGASDGLLAAGSEMKSAIALVARGEATVSQHLGELPHARSADAWQAALRDLSALRAVPPAAAAADLRPDSHATRAAAALGLPLVPVQHHHAHAAACLAENAIPGPAFVLAWDGTGLGTDGTVWGGEFLSSVPARSTRLASLLPFPLIGAEAAIRQPRRIAFALARLASRPCPPAAGLAPGEERLFAAMDGARLNSPATSSMGRLFDGVSALLGLCPSAAYEGHAAMLLQAAAQRLPPGTPPPAPYPFDWLPPDAPGTPSRLDWRPLVRAILDAPQPVPLAAARFHATLAAVALAAARRYPHPDVCLTGGCFQNPLLLELVHAALETAGFRVRLHRAIPPNDAGLPIGQLAAAAARIRLEARPLEC